MLNRSTRCRTNPKFARYHWAIMHHRIDVEGCKVAASDVFGVILGVIEAEATSDVIVLRHALAQVHHDRPC